MVRKMFDFKFFVEQFEDFLAQSTSPLSARERLDIQEYLDVGEYDLALSTAVAIYVEEKKRPTELEISRIIALHKLISRSFSEAESRLRAIE